ncbi:MAG: hypothetical protein MJZ33_08075 [Paludibacteraceae bacterium]|nr:hypothetical protein [Paludibacteraceae bacterium]
MRKPTLLVPILFVYALGMTIWGYVKGTIDLMGAISFMGMMCVLLGLLWFMYRKKEKYREEREAELRAEEEKRRLSR